MSSLSEMDESVLFIAFLGAWMAGNGTAIIFQEYGEPLRDPLLTGGTFIVCGFLIALSEYLMIQQKEL